MPNPSTNKKFPLVKSNGVLSDIWWYVIRNPEYNTLVKYNSKEERETFSVTIMQRIGIDVHHFRLLNIHQIGIEAPAGYIFDELMRWRGDAICWPNHIARIHLGPGKENIVITLLGRYIKLFSMKAIRIQQIPAPNDTDNARYFLYNCSGGYPIGVFSLFMRSSIPERDENEMSQLIFLTSFNFYGKQFLSGIKPLRKAWEFVHNRVTSHVACRFKQLVEWSFENFTHQE